MPTSPFSDFVPQLFAVLGGLSVAGGAYVAGYVAGKRAATRRLNSERELRRFSEIYAPCFGLFTTRHVTMSSATAAPYFSQRWTNARELAADGRLKRAFFALFDKRNLGTSGEMEFGDFPLEEITQILRGREQFADDKLLHLVGKANRAQYEDQPRPGELTTIDIELLEHIGNEYEKLCKRFVAA